MAFPVKPKIIGPRAKNLIKRDDQNRPGRPIRIHSKYWEGGCFLAYDKGEFGYVDAQYVR